MSDAAKTIFFDLGNVLLFFDLGKMRKQIAQFSGLSLPIIRKEISKLFEPYEKGDIATKDLHAHFCSLAGKPLGYQGLLHAVADIFIPNEPVISLLPLLKENGVRLFLLSNTCEAHFSYAYQQFPFLHLFDGYILSYKVGARKPDAHIFEEALRVANCQRNHCFYTDDIPEYVAAAKDLHIDAELFTSVDALKTQLRTRNLL